MRVRHLLIGGLVLLSAAAANAATSFIGGFQKVDTVASTVPANGDLNPYGVAVVPASKGKLIAGNVLVSNFNDMANQQGTGTTIVEISTTGHVSLFAQIDPAHLPGACPGGVGLTTALVVLRSGWVIVGSLPASMGASANAEAGCLIVLNDQGTPVKTISGGQINGPWDMTAFDGGFISVVFVTNVLNGTVAAGGDTVNEGTVVRLLLLTPDPDIDKGTGVLTEISRTVIASGFDEKTDPMALVIGPTGVGLGFDGTLYVADPISNRIAAIPDALFRLTSAGPGKTLTAGLPLNAPLGLAIAPNGDILTVNSLDGKIVETTLGGTHVAVETLDNTPTPGSLPGAGALFGLAVVPGGKGVYFVDDDTNTLNLLH